MSVAAVACVLALLAGGTALQNYALDNPLTQTPCILLSLDSLEFTAGKFAFAATTQAASSVDGTCSSFSNQYQTNPNTYTQAANINLEYSLGGDNNIIFDFFFQMNATFAQNIPGAKPVSGNSAAFLSYINVAVYDNATLETTVYNLTYSTTQYCWYATAGSSYQCDFSFPYSMLDVSNNVVASLNVTNVQSQPFITAPQTAFSTVYSSVLCPGPEPSTASSTAGEVVGGVLSFAALAVISIFTLLKCRNPKGSEYGIA
eukprot:m.98655 g.98655  ORF g.98655 m.98655 type:complete len:259 (-) comp51413_c0_seq1:520-1296(-)